MQLINLHALRYFETVARLQHFTKAAQEMYVSQSTLSKAVTSLEEELGVPLFEKNGRNVQLTRYGTILRDYAFQGISKIDEGVQIIRGMIDSDAGNLCLSSIFTIGSQFLPALIRGFMAGHPNVKIQYYQKATLAILDQLCAGEIDLGFTGEVPKFSEYAHLGKEIVLTEELCLIVPESHPLAKRRSVPFYEVQDETFIGYNDDTGIVHSISQTLKKAGLKADLNYSFRVTEDSAIVGLVREGLGIGLISTIPTICTEGVVKVQIEQPVFSRKLYMVWNQERFLSPVAREFRKFVLTSG